MIYLDNAATSLKKPQAVIDAVTAAMGSFGNCGRSAHEGSLSAARAVYETREKLAALFGCTRAERVCFTANSTQALNIAIGGLFSPGEHVISTDCEHNSVLRPLYRQEALGVEVSFVPADAAGNLCYDAFTEQIRPNTRAIVCTAGSNLTGNLMDLARIGQIAQANKLLFVVDASQTAGVFPIDMQKLHIDVLCFTGHKSLMGPQGTGGLCVAEGVEIRPMCVGGTGVQTELHEQPPQYPTRLEAGTLNAHGLAGLSAALDFLARTGMASIREKEQALMRRFYRGVQALDGVTVYGDFSQAERAPIVCLNIRDYDSGAVADALYERWEIATRPGAHCAPRMHAALGTKAQGAVRFSFGYFNTEEEIDTAIAAVERIASE